MNVLCEPGDIIEEATRLSALRSLDVLDTRPEAEFDDLARLAGRLCDAPVALVSLVDENRQWFKARVGADLEETDLSRSICRHAIRQTVPLVIEDTTLDPRTADNPLNEEYGMRFYAGAPLIGSGGVVYGTLCVLDMKPRTLSGDQIFALRTLARQVTTQLEMRRAVAEAQASLEEQKLLRQEIDHRVKNSLQQAAVFLRLQKRHTADPSAEAALEAALGRIIAIASVHDSLGRLDATDSVSITAFLSDFVDGLSETLPDAITVTLDAPALKIANRFAVSLAIIVNEFAANAVKHAFGDGQPGVIDIRMVVDQDTIECILSDDGKGLGDAQPSGGLGLRIIEVSAQSLGAEVLWPVVPRGTRLHLKMPRQGLEGPFVASVSNPSR